MVYREVVLLFFLPVKYGQETRKQGSGNPREGFKAERRRTVKILPKMKGNLKNTEIRANGITNNITLVPYDFRVSAHHGVAACCR